MHPTRIRLNAAIRQHVSPELSARLADAIDLGLQLKQAHWNVKGPHFRALHELFDAVHRVVAEQIDALAERLTALGGTAEGTLQAVARRSVLQPYPVQITAGEAHLAAVADALAEFGRLTRAAIDHCDAAGDKVTADLFNEVTGVIDHQLWLVEAHLQG
jgi:starvation-inducible DNA-binding protein